MFTLTKQDKNFERIPLDVKGRLFVSPMPYGPYDPYNQLIKTYKRHHVQAVAMLVTDKELEIKAKRDVLKVYAKAKIEVYRLPFADLTCPPVAELTEFIYGIAHLLKQGKRIALHCNAGVGRTCVVASGIVRILTGCDGPSAIKVVSKYTRLDMTTEQKRAIEKLQPLPEHE
jgi:protein-tyrosine phosphatase